MWVCLKCGKDFPTSGSCPDCGTPFIPSGPTTNGLAGRVLNERYTLLEPLGSGGMGTVFRAKRRDLDAFFAIKILRNDLNPETDILPRFFAEARHASQLKHPHTVRVFDFGATDDGLIYLVMELVDGVLISQMELPLSVDRALAITRQICGAVAEAHERGLVHRDIKPDNIMVSRVDGRDFARVLDFGIATLEATTGMTADGTMVGTPEYISPEQAAGLRVDRRADFYGLGLVMYEMVTGRPPFKGSRMVVAYKHINERPPAPGVYVDIPDVLDRLIVDCLAKRPEDRPQSVDALRHRLDECIAVAEGHVPDSKRPRREKASARESTVAPTAERRIVSHVEDDSEAIAFDTATMTTFVPNWKRRLVIAVLMLTVAAVGLWLLRDDEDGSAQPPASSSPVSSPAEIEVSDSPDEIDSPDEGVAASAGPEEVPAEGTGATIAPAEGIVDNAVTTSRTVAERSLAVLPTSGEEGSAQDEPEVERVRSRRRDDDAEVERTAEPAFENEDDQRAEQAAAEQVVEIDGPEDAEPAVDPRAVIRSRTQELLDR